jgi:hypothetical protein
MIFHTIPTIPEYEITSTGILRNAKTKYIKSQRIGSNGYYVVTLFNKETKKTINRKVHRLLAEVFLEKVENKKCINHIDGNKLNNDLSNLEWCTQKENARHAIRIGLTNNVGEKNGMSILNVDQVVQIKKFLKDGVSQQKIAKIFNVSRSAILCINLGKNWKHVNIE